MVIFAGSDGTATPLADLRALNLSTLAWTSLGSAVFGRVDHAAIYDPVGDRMIVHGGNDGANSSDLTWQATLPTSGAAVWSSPASPGPPARRGSSAVYDEKNRRMLLVGGLEAGGVKGDVWVLPLAAGGAWAEAFPATAPAGRLTAGSAYDPFFERLLIFSGDNGSFLPVDDLVFALNLGVFP
jgi:hypothetical protein